MKTKKNVMMDICKANLPSQTEIKISHTKGQWIVRSLNVYGGNSELIADCNWTNKSDDANAKLISASPDLLLACNLALGFISKNFQHIPDLEKLQGNEVMLAIKNTIKKATI